MVSRADVRVALEAGLWEALVDSGDRAAMRSSCRAARAMADMLHDAAVLPLGPDTLGCAACIAAYHCKLGVVRALHVRCSACSAEDEEHTFQFIEAYSAALGAALPATHCSIDVPDGWRLPTPCAAVLLQHVVPGVESLDLTLGSCGSYGESVKGLEQLEQLVQLLEPCTCLRSLRILPDSPQHGASTGHQPLHEEAYIDLEVEPGLGLLMTLCELTHLHTLSGPWDITATHGVLQYLCAALPSLTTLGFYFSSLSRTLPREAPHTCISRQLHTLAAWDAAAYEAGADARGSFDISAMAIALPAVQRLSGVGLASCIDTQAEVLAVRAAVQRFATCAQEWRLRLTVPLSSEHVTQGLPAGCLALLQHLELTSLTLDVGARVVAAVLGCLVSAAPNLATVTLHVNMHRRGDLVGLVTLLRQAPHLHTLRLDVYVDGFRVQRAAALEGVVRCLAQPGAEGEAAPCRALRRVLLRDAQPRVLDACRRTLEAGGIAVRVDSYA